MKTIHKYVFDPNGPRLGIEIDLPRGASLLCACRQHKGIVVYALVDTEEETETWRFWVVGTGGNYDPLPLAGASYLGTVLFDDDSYVLHVFAMPPAPPIIVPLPPGASEAEFKAAKEALLRKFRGLPK